jgi:hypothetical protein
VRVLRVRFENHAFGTTMRMLDILCLVLLKKMPKSRHLKNLESGHDCPMILCDPQKIMIL